MACGFFPDLWYDFSAWLDLGGKEGVSSPLGSFGQPTKRRKLQATTRGGKQDEATDVLRKAVERFLPKASGPEGSLV